MTKRKGLGKGFGSGYRNLAPKDPTIHSQSSKGIKQPQGTSFFQMERVTQAMNYTPRERELFENTRITPKTLNLLKKKLGFKEVTDFTQEFSYPQLTTEKGERILVFESVSDAIFIAERELRDDREYLENLKPELRYKSVKELVKIIGWENILLMGDVNVPKPKKLKNGAVYIMTFPNDADYSDFDDSPDQYDLAEMEENDR